MIRTILLFLFVFISVNANCQNENLSLQYGKGYHVFSKWKQGSYIKVKTFSNGTFSGVLHISDTSSIVVKNSVIQLSDIKRIASFPWPEIVALSSGAATAVLIHPFFGITAASIVALVKLFPNKRTSSKQFKIIPIGTSFQKQADPTRYAFDSAQFVQKYFRLYRYPVRPFLTTEKYRSHDFISVISNKNEQYSGRIQFIDSLHISLSGDTVNLRDIASIKNRWYNTKRDTLVVSGKKWRLAKKDVQKKYISYRRDYISKRPQGHFVYLGTDIPKLFVPKPNLRIDYYNRYHFGISASAGWKPFNPEGQGLGFTWQSNVDFCSESQQYKINPFVWFTTKSTRMGFRFGPYFYYKHLDADHVYVALNIDYGGDRYDLYWHDKTVTGIGLQMGSFHQRAAGFDIQCSFGWHRAVSCDSIVNYYHNQVERSDYWGPAVDISLVYSFRINKHSKRRQDIE